MTALTIPPEVAAECAEKLFSLAETANRDAMTLIKQAMALARGKEPARPLGVLKKYVRDYEQYGFAEVSEVVAAIEAAADPKHVKRLHRIQAQSDARRAEHDENCKVAIEQAWQPGGERWNNAIKSAEKDSKVLALAAKVMREGTAGGRLANAMRAFYEEGGCPWAIERYLARDQWAAICEIEGDQCLDAATEILEVVLTGQRREKKSPLNGNVITGPWAS